MFSILLWNERTQQLEHRFSSRYGERITRERAIPLGQGLIGLAAQQREPMLSPDVRKDPRYITENPETRSELSVPLLSKGEVIGVLDLEHTRVNYYNEDHQRTLSTLAAQVAISIANARLYQRIHEEEQRMERDLEMARKVQLRLMPARPPKLERAEIAASFLRPARSAAICTTFSTMARGESRWPLETSAARRPPQRSMRQWSAGFCGRSRRSISPPQRCWPH